MCIRNAYITHLMETECGIRGIVGHGFDTSLVLRYCMAFTHLLLNKYDNGTDDNEGAVCKCMKKCIIVGRDSRISGLWVQNVAVGIFLSRGFDVKCVGIVPTPTLQYIILDECAMGGLMITASHNPLEWNGLKFVGDRGIFISPDSVKELVGISNGYVGSCRNCISVLYDQCWDVCGEYRDESGGDGGSIEGYIGCIVGLPYIRKGELKVCLDTINGAGCHIIPRLMKEMGVNVVDHLNDIPDGRFKRDPEPTVSNLHDLCLSIRSHNADLGFAVDPDADRCVVIDENGEALGEEYTLALCVYYFLHYIKKGPICKNLSTSRMIDDLGKNYECPVYSTPIGEVHVALKMLQTNAIIGGEGNGGVMLPDVHIGRDSCVAMALILSLYFACRSEDGEFVASKFRNLLPRYYMTKLKVKTNFLDGVEAIDAIMANIVEIHQGLSMNTEDGVKIEFPNYWVHLRKSKTEPIIRVIVEAPDYDLSQEIANQFANHFQIATWPNNSSITLQK